MSLERPALSTLEDEIREAISDGSLFLEYQPLVSLPNRDVAGVEALIRWKHPRGVRYPSSFIPQMQESDVMLPLGYWVLERAARQVTAWRAQTGKDLTVYVNVSPHHFHRPEFLSRVEAALVTHALPPDRLALEITEHSPLSRDEATGEKVKAVQDLGVQVVLDDFGAGFNTLQALQAIRTDSVKIDQELVIGVTQSEWCTRVVEEVIEGGRRLGLLQIVEGVETLEHREIIERLAPDLAQGYVYGRPVSAEEFPQKYLQ